MSIHLYISILINRSFLAKFNLETIFPLPYFRDFWHSQNTNIKRAIDLFDLGQNFVNTNVNEKVFVLNKTILNILSNFIQHETLTVDDNDPFWFTILYIYIYIYIIYICNIYIIYIYIYIYIIYIYICPVGVTSLSRVLN